ncbi:hemagglutinin [Bordetella genomosp. 1]|uniref:Hemagglutinin n=1 Tax=Bordetella genomosp. 1 TaxID=1395607 RepID=A0A261RUT7_9BORD|nr:lactonase family protein [Bordetella genomosp. 1]OZI28846.1 hemagglutinin [Bordetella genomosp. 1]
MNAPATAAFRHAYVGTRTTRERNARGEGISVYAFDPASASLRCIQVVRELVNPSFLAVDAARTRLYSVHGDQREISAFAIAADGTLAPLNRQSTGGLNPVHLALAPAGGHVVVSNHISGDLAVLPLSADGALEPVCQQIALEGTPGPHRVEQPHAKPHHNPFDPVGRHVVVPDKGLDRVFVFRFDAGRLHPASSVPAREGAGPRHLVFHPRLAMAYAINELDSTVVAYAYDATRGSLSAQQLVLALPPGHTGNSRAAALVIAPDGRHLYASHRGADCLTVFAIDADSGHLRYLVDQPSLGRTPRFATFTPDGRHLFVLNEDSDTIVAFARDAATGTLRPQGAATACASPVCMVFA